MISRDEAIEIIAAAKATHFGWWEYFDKHPHMEGQHGSVGDKEHHAKYISDYDLVLDFLYSLPESG